MDDHQPNTQQIMQLPLPGGGFAEFVNYGDGQLPGLFMSKVSDDEAESCGFVGDDEQEDGAAAALA